MQGQPTKEASDLMSSSPIKRTRRQDRSIKRATRILTAVRERADLRQWEQAREVASTGMVVR